MIYLGGSLELLLDKFQIEDDMERYLASLVRSSVLQESRRFSLDSALICSIIYQESYSGTRRFSESVFAAREEEAFFNRYLANKGLVGTQPNYNKVSRKSERRFRSISWGPMQVMGQVAREFGFDHPYLPALCWPTYGIHYGCKALASYIKKFGLVRGIRRYNGDINSNDTLIYYEKIQLHLDNKVDLEILDHG